MCYQLPIANDKINENNFFIQNCSYITNSSFPNDTSKWFGLELTTHIDRFIGVRNLN